VGLVAAKRASLIGRGPQLGTVKVAMDLFGLRGGGFDDPPIECTLPAGHSYVLQREFVDAVDGTTWCRPNRNPL